MNRNQVLIDKIIERFNSADLVYLRLILTQILCIYKSLNLIIMSSSRLLLEFFLQLSALNTDALKL